MKFSTRRYLIGLAGGCRRRLVVYARAPGRTRKPKRSKLHLRLFTIISLYFDAPLYYKANVYVRKFRACIADFGVSTIARTEPSAGTHKGSTPSLVSFNAGGSLDWMSPELLDPQKFNVQGPRPTRESDCFALGMVIYEVWTYEILLFIIIS